MAVKPNTADRVLALFTDPEAVITAKQIMDTLKLSRTTVNDNLRKLAEAGKVVRFDVNNVVEYRLTPAQKKAQKASARKTAKAQTAGALNVATGTLTPARRRAVAATTADMRKPVNGRTDDETPARTLSGRRRKGQIDGEIVAYFTANGNAPEGSYKVAQAIGSSAGAAYVALRRMATEGTVVQTQSEPDKYALPA